MADSSVGGGVIVITAVEVKVGVTATVAVGSIALPAVSAVTTVVAVITESVAAVTVPLMAVDAAGVACTSPAGWVGSV
jgi:hypothetical protein